MDQYLLALCFVVLVVSLGAAGSAEFIQSIAWCSDQYEDLDWNLFRNLAQSEECYEAEGEDAILRTECSPAAVDLCAQATRFLLKEADRKVFPCANGIVFVLAITLVYAPHLLPERDRGRARALMWGALQQSFLLDTTVWPVKTFDALSFFDRAPPSFVYTPLGNRNTDDVTLVVPRCPEALALAIQASFPGLVVYAGLRDEVQSVPPHWRRHRNAWARSTNEILNEMLRKVKTEFVLVVVGSALPQTVGDLQAMVRVLSSRNVTAVAGPIVDGNSVYADFCHRLRAKHWHLSFDKSYDYSITFNESSRASVRGYWFQEHGLEADGPCKVCQTLPPTFLARVDALAALPPFHPAFDGEWGLLHYFVKASHTPTVGAEDAQLDPLKPGLRDFPVMFAVCPFINTREVEELGGPHLYGRADLTAEGDSRSTAWFGEDTDALGPVLGGSTLDPMVPAVQAELFMELSSLKVYEGVDGIKHRSGCKLETTNCPVPDWIYRGWAIPPCCKETMRHLLFYIDDVFRELGIRYIVTDGVLLGSYKFAGMLDWDADVDLHIHDDDFDRLESEVKPRVDGDGHFLRKHANNASFLLQANEQNYLLIELNKRSEPWNKESLWWVPIEGRLFPAMDYAHVNLTAWYGFSFFEHRLRHVPDWEEASRPMYCGTPYHHNCLDDIPSGRDCRLANRC